MFVKHAQVMVAGISTTIGNLERGRKERPEERRPRGVEQESMPPRKGGKRSYFSLGRGPPIAFSEVPSLK